METLNLSLPRQHDFTDPTVERDVRRLRSWLSNLPLMDVVETVRLVLGALNSLNEQKLDSRLRFECLEAYRATAQRLFQTLDPLSLRQLALSKARRLEAIRGVAQVFQSLAGGYKLVVASQFPQAGVAPGALLGPAINRALEQLVYSVLDCYRFYREVPPELTAETHELYLFAHRHGLLDVSLETEAEGRQPVTTALLFHAGMLLSLTEPERLGEGEVSLLFDVLMQHAGNCRVIPGNRWEGSGEGLFVIDLHGAGLPVPCTTLSAPVAVRNGYLLDAGEALRAIQAQLERTPASVRMQSPEGMLLKRLLPERSGREQRVDTRRRDGRHADLLPGLANIHDWLQSAGEFPDEDLLERVTSCRVLDSSRQGMKLGWCEGVAGDVRVGELLGIVESAGEHAGLQLAVIRSVSVLHEGGTETGIEIFPGGARAVSCDIPGHAGGSAVQALFMPADEEGGYAATLLVANGFYARDAVLLIQTGGRELRARAGRRVMETPVFDRFEFTAV